VHQIDAPAGSDNIGSSGGQAFSNFQSDTARTANDDGSFVLQVKLWMTQEAFSPCWCDNAAEILQRG